MSRRLKAVSMLMIWTLSIFNGFAMEVTGAATTGVFSIKNDTIELLVNGEDGRFAVKTVEGSPNRSEDENKSLLYLKEIPETTFTTFRIDGKDYIYGNSYNGIMMEGGFTDAPKTKGMANISTWKAEDIEIAQKLEMTDNVSSSDVGNVKISYLITNKGTSSKSIGTRVLMDTMLGNNDGSRVSLDGKSDITFETEVTGDDIPVYWRTTDSAENPKVVSYGFIKGWGNTEPDRMTIAHWSALSSTKWDYSINRDRNISSVLNEYKSADSAVALYWEPKTLEPGQSVQVETYYGLGNVNSNDGSTFNLNVLAPSKLSIEGEAYKGNPFEIMLELDNNLSSSTELAGITAELILPEGLELAEGEQGSYYFYRINSGKKETAEWKVVAANTQKLKVLQYMIRISCMGRELRNIKKHIIIPGFEMENFDIGYTDIAPRNLYYNDENNAIQIIGRGFDMLKDKTSYEVSFTDSFGSFIQYFTAEDITIINDNQMRISIPTGLDIGIYKVVINHKNDMLDYTLPQQIMLTSDERYKSRNYGIMAIKEESTGVQSVKLYENESQLTSGEKSNAKLIIRGKIRSISTDNYEIYGDTIAINNDIYYKGNGDNVLSVYKSGGSFAVKGNGELYMQSALMGSSMEITLKKGYFLIDSATAEIRDQEGEFNDIAAIKVGYFPILVKKIRIQSNGEVKIDGLLQLDNKYFNFLTGLGTGSVKSDLKDLSLTNSKIDIDAEIEIPFPRWKLGGFQSKDYATKSMTEITFFINTIKGAYGFEAKAENIRLRLLDINAKMGFDKNLYPDYFEFSNNYGKLPKPIGSTGLGFESIGGGIYGLKSMMDSLKYGILPTGSSIAVRADIIDLLTANLRIKGYTLIGLRDIEAILSCSGLDLEGDAYIYFIDVGDIIGHFDFSGGYIEADLNVLDIIIADAYLGISSNEIKGSINAKVQVPDYVWFIGGKEISGFGAELSTSRIKGSIRFLGVGVGIAYSWKDNDVDFDVASRSEIDGKGIYTVNTKDARGRDVTVTYGTNIERLKEIEPSYPSYSVCYVGGMGRALALGAFDHNYNVTVDGSYESAIIEMKYTSSETPDIKITMPDGVTEYDLVDGLNYRNQIIPADISASGNEEKYLFVTIPSPTTGTWKIESDQMITVTPCKVKIPAAFESISAEKSAGKIKTDWELNVTDGSAVSLYLVKEDDKSAMMELAKDLSGELGTYECDIPIGVTTGMYKVRGEVKRSGIDEADTFSFDDMYSEAFEILDAEAPAAPIEFKVEAAGNGMMKAQWTAAETADEYRIYAVDDTGKRDNTVKAMLSIEGTESNTVFGGTQKDSEGNEYGWTPGRSYRFALYAVNKSVVEDVEIEHISSPVYSGEIELPVPEPPEFTVSFSSEYGNINVEKDENDIDISYTNTSYIKCSYISDAVADVVFYVNGNNVADGRDDEILQELELNYGSNLIEIEAVKANGDKTLKSYEFYYDNKAPDLMVQSPNSSDNIMAGTVLVSGKATSGSRLYVNGTQLEVSEDGSFNEEYILSNSQRETITIAAVDLAGNSTEYSTEVLNSDSCNVIRVRIMPQPERLKIGDSIQLKLYGVTKDNSEVLLEAEKTQWQLFDAEGKASLTADGILTAVKPGEIIINGRYTVSGDMAYEDALIINVLPRERDSDEDESEYIGRSTSTGSLVRKSLAFKSDDEITIPGFMKLRFTGNEAMPGGYIEVFEIKDLLGYRQQSGNKDFLSSILDVRVPKGYLFNSAVELTIYFDRNKAKDIRKIGIYVYNEETGAWNMLGGAVDEENGTITVRIPHFSKFAVMENSGILIMTDMDRHWAKDAVYRLIDRGIVNGIKSSSGEYKFEPERTVTRAEFAKMLSLSEGSPQTGIYADLSAFADDSEIQPWAQPYLKYCSKNGWIKGKAIGQEVYMKPQDTITRAEAAAMISRAMNLTADDEEIKAEFSDKDKIPQWAAVYIDQLLEKKLLQGYSDGSFKPDRVLTRAEAAKIFDAYVSEKN
jgi:hypothetical protein